MIYSLLTKHSYPVPKRLSSLLLICIASTALNAFIAPASAESARTETVYLLLHGLASSAATWEDLAVNRFSNNCTKVKFGDAIQQASTCYRYEFADKKVDGFPWENGDGSTFTELGDEVALVIDQIESVVHPESIILVGHSRGGLAARAYLQDLTAKPPHKLGLLTIGTPHQGSPFGRIQYYLTHLANHNKGYAPDDLPFADILGSTDSIKLLQTLLFSPSTGYLATAHDKNLRPIRNPNVSAAIWSLNDNVGNLSTYVSSFGQIHSDNLRLGAKTPGLLNARTDLLRDESFFDPPILDLLVPGDYREMRKYILQNIGRTTNNGRKWKCLDADKLQLAQWGWACNGDSIVPAISQRMKKIKGFNAQGKPFHVKGLNQVHHVEETGKVKLISNMLALLAKDLAGQ